MGGAFHQTQVTGGNQPARPISKKYRCTKISLRNEHVWRRSSVVKYMARGKRCTFVRSNTVTFQFLSRCHLCLVLDALCEHQGEPLSDLLVLRRKPLADLAHAHLFIHEIKRCHGISNSY